MEFYHTTKHDGRYHLLQMFPFQGRKVEMRFELIGDRVEITPWIYMGSDVEIEGIHALIKALQTVVEISNGNVPDGLTKVQQTKVAAFLKAAKERQHD